MPVPRLPAMPSGPVVKMVYGGDIPREFAWVRVGFIMHGAATPVA